MTNLGTLLEIAVCVAVLAAPIVAFNRWLAGADGPGLADILAQPLDPAWPRGVQEEEPVRWRVEALRPRRARAEPGHPGVPVGACLVVDRGEG